MTGEFLAIYDERNIRDRISLFEKLELLSRWKWFFSVGEFLIKLPFVERLPFVEQMYRVFFAGVSLEEALSIARKLSSVNVLSMVDYAMEASEDVVEHALTIQSIVDIVYACRQISYWKNEGGYVVGIPIKLTGLIHSEILAKMTRKETLNKEENFYFRNLIERMRLVCGLGKQYGLKIFIDAEESWLQGGIDDITLTLMKEFNKGEAVVFGTIQFFRRDAPDILDMYLGFGEREGVVVGIKAVRGAYHEKEIEWAKKNGTTPIVFTKKEDTDKCYNQQMERILKNIERVEFNCATHNEGSISLCCNLMEKNGIGKKDGRVTFAQLYGMADTLTYKLAREGYLTIKYLPFGSKRKALRYLLRRARENSASPYMLRKEILTLKGVIGLRSSTG